MGLALRAIGSALSQTFSHVAVSLVANLTAMLLSIPLLALLVAVAVSTRSISLIPLGITLLIGILPNPAAAGLQRLAHNLARGEMVNFGDHRDGLREYGRPALLLWLLSLVGTAFLMLSVVFYARTRFPLSGLLELLFLYLLLVWLALHLYVYPLLLEQKVKRVRLIYRNALVMTISRPIFTLLLLTVWLAVLLLTAATGFATVIGLAMGAALQQNALARILPTFPASRAAP